MDYTHCFAYDPNAESFIDAWPRIVADAQVIAAHVQKALNIRLADGLGHGEPQIAERWICLNGPAPRDLGHESFLLDPTPWDGCDEQPARRCAGWANHQREEFEQKCFLTGFCKTAHTTSR